MAILGLVVLVVYGFFAIGSPLVTPYDPQRDIVAGAYAPPLWYSYFSEGSRLSQNFVLESQPGFFSDPAQQGWDFIATDSHLTESFDRNTSFGPGSGSVKITLDRGTGLTGTFTATFEKVFPWPYRGPPARFAATLAVMTPTASSLEPVQVTAFVKRTTHDPRTWNLTDSTSWISYPFTTGGWHLPTGDIDSNAEAIKTVLHTDINPAQLIFSSPDQYAYGAIVTFTSGSLSTQPLQVFLDDMNLRLYGTSWGLLGTDASGLDIFSQLVYGSRISLAVGLLSAFIGIVLGLVVGLIAGYLGKVVDEVLMRFTDMLLVIPGLPLLIVLVAVIGNTLGPGRLTVLILVIGFLGWMGFARVVRSQVLSLKERPFVEAAKAAGAGTGHITTRHIIPNIVGLIYVNLALAVPGAILSEAALSFLGLGDVTVLSWGRMLNLVEENGAQRIWWWVLPPGLSIALVSLAFVMIGFSLDTLFNPRLRQRR